MAITWLLINPYVDAILVIALGICIGGILNSLTPYIERVPWVGGPIANALRGMSQAITHACGVILAPISDAVGGTLHQVSRLVDWTYGEFRRHSSLLLYAATLISGLALAVAAIRALVHRLTVSHTGQTARIKTLERELHGIDRELKRLERDVSKGIGNDIRIHIKALEHDVATIENKTLPALGAEVATAESDLSQLGRWIAGAFPIPRGLTFAGIVAAALSTLGLGWLRCNSNPFNNNKNACGLWGDLAGLLGLVTAVLVAEDFEALVREMQAVEGEAIGLAKDLFNVG